MSDVLEVTVNCAAVANAYDAAYREVRGVGCHINDWNRVRDNARDGTSDGKTFLVDGPYGQYLVNVATGWMLREPEIYTYRVINPSPACAR